MMYRSCRRRRWIHRHPAPDFGKTPGARLHLWSAQGAHSKGCVVRQMRGFPHLSCYCWHTFSYFFQGCWCRHPSPLFHLPIAFGAWSCRTILSSTPRIRRPKAIQLRLHCHCDMRWICIGYALNGSLQETFHIRHTEVQGWPLQSLGAKVSWTNRLWQRLTMLER